jgi:hypothetical protein
MGPKLQSPASGRIEEHFGFDRADLRAIYRHPIIGANIGLWRADLLCNVHGEYVSDDVDDCQHTGTPQITLTVYPAG